MSTSRKDETLRTTNRNLTYERVEEELTLSEFLSRESGRDDLVSEYARGWALKPSRYRMVEENIPNSKAIRLRSKKVAADPGIEEFQSLREALQSKIVSAAQRGRIRVFGHRGTRRDELPAHALSTFPPEAMKLHKNEIGIFANVMVEVLASTKHQRIVRFIEEYCAKGQPKTEGFLKSDIQTAVEQKFGNVSDVEFRDAWNEAKKDPGYSRPGPMSTKNEQG